MIGRLTKDAEPKQTQSGTSVSRYTLAVDRPSKDEKSTDFISCIAFGKSADFANKFLKKGVKIAIEGRIQTGSYEKDGKTVYTTDIVVDRHEFCESKQNNAPDVAYTAPAAPASTDDFQIIEDNGDLPF